MEEIIDIGLNDLEPININLQDSRSSVNFGPGIELLMNDKVKSSNNMSSVDLGELDNLEAELNELSSSSSGNASSSGNSDTRTFSGFASNLFGFGKTENKNVKMSIDEDNHQSRLGSATSESVGSAKTWDGFSKTSDVPVGSSSSSRLSEREKRRKKRLMIKKLEEWKDKGLFKNGSHFTIDSNYEEVEDEYETALEDKRKKDSIKLQGWWFMTFVNSVEYANSAFNPFDINLDGWGEQINEDIDSYEEIFSELHEKYKGGKMSPELSLLLRIGFSAAVVNFTNKALSSATPGFNDVIRQSPELMRMFSNATVESMKKQSPSFSFAENILNPNMGAPPAPVKTREEAPIPQNMRPGLQFTQMPDNRSSNRPDINAGRGYEQPQQRQQQTNRPEMQGPRNTDIDNILSGLKPKVINIHNQGLGGASMDDDSVISIQSLKDIQNTTMPKKTTRRTSNKNNSERNTISLDI
jgi:hypothetical protein